MTISMDKQYRTRDGREVRIYAVDGCGKHSVHGAILNEDGWEVYHWVADGSAYPPLYADGNRKDLIEIKPRIQREYWMNLHKDYMIIPYPSKESADEYAMKSRIACVKVVIDCAEGEGL